MEQAFRSHLARRPEIEKCYRLGLINRRALARHLIAAGVAERRQMDAVVAMLRRYEFGAEEEVTRDLFPAMRISVKDRVLVLDFAKDKELLRRLERLIAQIDYDRGDTLKIVVGTSSIKLFVDQAKEAALRPLFERFTVKHRLDHLSELSLLFPEEAVRTRGVLSVIVRELAVRDIVVTELLTASPELLIYLREEYVVAAYGLLRSLGQGDA